MKYSHILAEVLSTPWAIRPEKLNTIMSILVQRAYSDSDIENEPLVGFVAPPRRMPFLVECDVSLIASEAASSLRILPDEGEPLAIEDTFVIHEWNVGMTAGRVSDKEAGYMELPDAEKDGTCDTVDVAGGISSDKGCCNLFNADPEADEFCCGDCTHSSVPDNETDEVKSRTQSVVIQASSNGNTVSRSNAPSIAVLPLFGTIAHRMGMMSDISGGTSTERFTQWFRAALQDSSVKSIVIDVDSPGGSVNGVPELADEIFQARNVKPIVAVANAQMASAAYFLGSQASELVSIPSGEAGSIGVFAAHEDVSQAAEKQGVKISLISAGKYKVEANPFEPLSEEARAALQEKVNNYYDMFVNAVARGRGATAEAVRNGFGQGRMLQAVPAQRANMVDRVQTMDRTLKRLGAKTKAVLPMPDKMKQEDSAVPAKAEAIRRRIELRRRELELLGR